MRTIRKIFNTTVSVKEGASRSVLRGIVQYDTLNEVNIRLSDGSRAFDYTGYTNIIFKVLKADGTAYIDSEGENVIATSPVDGIITVNLTGQSTAAAGLCQSVIEIYSDDGKMTTARLNYEVFEALGGDDGLETAAVDESENYYPVFQNLMADLSALEASIEEAEAKRVAAENARANAATGYVAKAQKAAEEAEMWAKASQDVAEGDFATRAELEAVEAGAAPAGYGLGVVNAPVCLDCNDAIETGWYKLANAKNGATVDGTYGLLEVSSRDDLYATQRIYNTANVQIYEYIRYLVNGVWHPWEWVNPPMQVGIEYRTTERYTGKAVYRKVVNFGALPNATSKTVDADFGSGFIIGIDGLFSPNQGDCFHVHPNISKVSCVGSEITIATTADMSAYNVSVQIRYYKTTDT